MWGLLNVFVGRPPVTFSTVCVKYFLLEPDIKVSLYAYRIYKKQSILGDKEASTFREGMTLLH